MPFPGALSRISLERKPSATLRSLSLSFVSTLFFPASPSLHPVNHPIPTPGSLIKYLKMKFSLLGVATFGASVSAIAFNPQPTFAEVASSALFQGFSPKPTEKAEFELLKRYHHRHPLNKRQISSTLLGWESPDNVCGWLDGNYGTSSHPGRPN
jgi:hypothetical protein